MNRGRGFFGLALSVVLVPTFCSAQSVTSPADQIVYELHEGDSKGDLDLDVTIITPAAYSEAGVTQAKIIDIADTIHSQWAATCGNGSKLTTTDAKSLVERIAASEGFDVKLAAAIAQQESQFNHQQISEKGAVGLFQLMPDTAAALHVNACDPEQNIRGGLAYFDQLKQKFGNPVFALAAYNAGPDRIDQYHGVPPYKETLDYVAKILTNYYSADIQSELSVSGSTPARLSKVSTGAKPLQSKTAGSEWKSGFVMNIEYQQE